VNGRIEIELNSSAGVKVDGWGLGWGENWDSLADNDPCVTDASAAAEVATA
jgi:hypothetical protein